MSAFRVRDYFLVSIYAFALSYLAGAGPLVLPQLIKRVALENLVATALVGLRVVGLLTAIVAQPMAGVASDGAFCPTRCVESEQTARRSVFMVAGVALFILRGGYPLST